MSSKGDIFDQLAPKGDIFDSLATEKKPEGMEHGLASFYHQYPKEAVSGNIISNLVKPFENWGSFPVPGQRSTTSEFLERQAGIDKLPPEAQQEAQIANFVAGLIPLLFGKLPPKTGGSLPKAPPGGGGGSPINPLQQSYLEREAISNASQEGGFGQDLKQLIQKNRPSVKEGELAGQITPSEYTSPYNIAEQALKEVAPSGFRPTQSLGKELPLTAQPTAETNLAGRKIEPIAGEFEKPLGTSQVNLPPEIQPELNRHNISTQQQMAAKKISPTEFKSDSDAIVEVGNIARNIKQPIVEQFNKDFSVLRAKTANISGPQADLTKDLRNLLDEAQGSLVNKNATAAEKKVMSTTQELLNQVAEFTPEGEFAGYKPVSVAQLIKTKTTLGAIADWEMAESGFQGAFKNLYGKLDKTIETMLRNRAPKEFAEFQRINSRYSGFKNTFENKNIKGLFQRKNLDYSGTYNKLLNPDTMRAVERVLAHSDQGINAANKLKRDYFLKATAGKQPLTPREIEDLKSVLGPKFEKTIDIFNKGGRIGKEVSLGPKEATGKPLAKRITGATQAKPKKEVSIGYVPEKKAPNKLTKIAQKLVEHSKKTPESVLEKLNSRSGIKEIRKEYPRSAEKLIDVKARELLHDGEIKHNFKGGEISNFLNKTENRELFTEMFGEENVNSFVEMADKLKDQSVTLEQMRKAGIMGAQFAGAAKIFKIINLLI